MVVVVVVVSKGVTVAGIQGLKYCPRGAAGVPREAA